MATAYEIRINTDLSVRLAVLGGGQWSSFMARRVINNVGSLELVLPAGAVDPAILRRDYIISILRSVDGGAPTLLHEQNYLLRRIDMDGVARTITLTAYDLNDLLRRRIIAYYAGSAQARKTDQADDLMKALVRENLGSGATDYDGDTTRAIAASRMTVQADLGLGPSMTKGCAWRETLLDVLREIADTSTTAGTWLGFDLVGGMGTPPEFRTYIGQRGTDRRATMVPLSEASGTLANPMLTYDWTDEKTAIYAGGRGEEEDRIIQTALDETRIGQSYWGRSEAFVYASQAETDAAALTEARAKLNSARPRKIFTADFTDSPGVQYGRDVVFGDQVRATAFGRYFDCRIDAVALGVDSSGAESVAVALRSETLL